MDYDLERRASHRDLRGERHAEAGRLERELLPDAKTVGPFVDERQHGRCGRRVDALRRQVLHREQHVVHARGLAGVRRAERERQHRAVGRGHQVHHRPSGAAVAAQPPVT